MADKEVEDRLKSFIESDNIAALLIEAGDTDLVEKIGRRAVEQYELDDADEKRVEKKKKWKEAKKIAEQVIEQKNVPYENSANVKYPLLTQAAIDFNARAYPAIVQGNEVCRPKYFGNTQADFDQETVQGLQQQIQQIQQAPTNSQAEQQMKFQALQQAEAQAAAMNEELARFQEKQERGERACKYMNWQLFYEMETWDSDTDHLLLRVALFGEYYRKVWPDSNGVLNSKILSPEELVFPSTAQTVKQSPRKTEIFALYPNEIETRIRSGFFLDFPYDKDTDEPLEFIEQHRREDLDGDGYPEPYVVIIETKNNSVARIQANYQFESIIANDSGDVQEIIEEQYYVKYPFIPSLDGSFYCTGLFDILYPINDTLDTAFNQLLDSGKLSNSPPVFIDNGLKMKSGGSGTIKYRPGEATKVNTPAGKSVRDSVYVMEFAGPSDVLFQMLSLLLDSGKSLSGSTNALEGNIPMNAAPTTVMASVEQGLRVFTGIYKRLHRSVAQELNLIRRFNHINSRQDNYENVVDRRIGEDDFSQADFDYVPVSDPEVVTDMQKAAKGQFLMQFMNDPFFDQKALRERILEGGGVSDIDELIVDGTTMQDQIEMLRLGIQQTEAQNRQQELQIEAGKLAQKDKEIDIDRQTKKAQSFERFTSGMKNLSEIEKAAHDMSIDEVDQLMNALTNRRNTLNGGQLN